MVPKRDLLVLITRSDARAAPSRSPLNPLLAISAEAHIMRVTIWRNWTRADLMSVGDTQPHSRIKHPKLSECLDEIPLEG